ncbi:hypothetical protein [Kineosporia sp. R_H_3]|uniref:hypothetical protein n=1 Tax=Kineosporia sp. R_H_3 TaxID=1961848 RepID=UPI00117B21F0|nr:hypothetical protein [Kineosporia sp. R_H_3]
MTADAQFPTFCHINDHGHLVYRRLHRMVATSLPLNLWSPSSAYINDPSCRLSGREFVSLVETGLIRIAGREKWLLDQNWRSKHPFPGASWDKTVDGAIRSIALHDQGIPDVTQRRVIIARDERGIEKADQYLEEHPLEVARLAKLARQKNAPRKVHPGTLEVAFREASGLKGPAQDRKIAATILRAAFNHGDAFQDVGARAPYLIKDVDKAFLSIVSDDASRVTMAAPKDSRSLRADAQLAESLLELLRLLDIASPPKRRFRTLVKFYGGEEHRALITWQANLADEFQIRGQAATVEGVTRSLLDRLEEGRMDWMSGFDKGSMVAGGGAVVLDLTTSGFGPVAILGGLLQTISAGHAGLKKLGYVDQEYSGPHWPFAYIGLTRSPANLQRLVSLLEEQIDN